MGMPKRAWSCRCGSCIFCDYRVHRRREVRRHWRQTNSASVAVSNVKARARAKALFLTLTPEEKAERRAKENAPKKAWQERHPEKQREIERRKNARNNRLRKGVPLIGEAFEYAEILRFDPCVYCGGPAGEIDHIVPVNQGGKSVWENLASACKSCNSRKHIRSLLEYMLIRPSVGRQGGIVADSARSRSAA